MKKNSIPSYADAPFHCAPDERRERFFRELRRKPVKSFYESREWLGVRYRVLAKHGAICMLCKTGGSKTNPIQVDHIKPRSRYPELELDLENLQVLCKCCNMGKGAWDQTDWRRG